jgi:pyruvate/2-oxoglutarate dehydrogenase complex dihydrolipoamide acyltransferase (E2) component
MPESDFTFLPYPRNRLTVVDAGRRAVRRHIIHGIFELDVTLPRQRIRQHQETTGERLSFTAYIVACLARAVAAHPILHAYRDWRGRLVVFSEVDVVTLIETEKGGVALPHVIRRADQRSVAEISAEIRSVQQDRARSAQSAGLSRWGPYFPRFVRDIVTSAIIRSPQRFKRIAGTTIVTSVGMFASGSFWGINFLPWHTMGLVLGGIASKPVVIDGQVAIRELLDVTLSIDHDIVDGAPAARFAQRFKELVESADLLE